ncbi:MAG: hypothetical protein CL609_13380 [Anaerolineaceae bacterium]|nr:hypothetical protein [Anaerolineaceae bacterium]
MEIDNNGLLLFLFRIDTLHKMLYDFARVIMDSNNLYQTNHWIYKIPILKKLWPIMPQWLHQIVKFGIVGGINTSVDLGIYWLLTRFILVDPAFAVIAKAISYTAGVINSYFWNKNFTFRSKDNSWAAFILFFSINLVAVGINSGIMWLGLHIFHQGELISLLMATGVTLIWNFTTSKFIVFKK